MLRSMQASYFIQKPTYIFLHTQSLIVGQKIKFLVLKKFFPIAEQLQIFYYSHFRVLGVILLHPTANASTMMESFKNSFSKWQMKNINASAENIVAFRKFGHKVSLSRFQNQFGVISLFQKQSSIILILFTTSA